MTLKVSPKNRGSQGIIPAQGRSFTFCRVKQGLFFDADVQNITSLCTYVPA